MSPHIRSKVVNSVKDSFLPYMKHIGKIESLPIRISLKMHDTIRQANWDLDNQWLYNKCFQDLLVKLNIIPDDDIKYVTKSAAPEFVPVDNESQRKLVFTLEPEEREEILKYSYYDELYSND